MMLSQRQKKILKLIVEEYVRTVEPVGSKVLTTLPEFDYSSATIRNDMSVLEMEGYITKPHTSSGRVPTEMGYKMYVEMMMEDKQALEQEGKYPLIDEIFERNSSSREEAIRESMALVSQLTNYASVVLGSSAYDAKIRKIQFISLNANSAVIILVTNQGYVESKRILVPEDINPRDVERVIAILNDTLYDCPISEIDAKLQVELRKGDMKERVEYYDELLGVFVNAIANMAQDKYFMSGQSNMMNQPEFQDISKLKEIMKVLEEKEVLKLMNIGNNEITIRIGQDNTLSALKDCSFITVPYVDAEGTRGAIAVIGPKRMQYAKVIPLLEYIAQNMNKI